MIFRDRTVLPRIPSSAGAGGRVVVADHDRRLRRWIAAALASIGYEVIECHDGEDLLDSLGSAILFKQWIDLIIADAWMPAFSGLDVLAGLRRAHGDVPVILMTEHMADVRERAIECGASALLDKPFDLDDLLTTVVCLTTPAKQLAVSSGQELSARARPHRHAAA